MKDSTMYAGFNYLKSDQRKTEKQKTENRKTENRKTEIRNPYIQYMYSYPHKTAYRELAGISLKDYVPYLAGAGHGLYVHIPFCQSKCGYCNLFSVTGQDTEAVEKYLQAVQRQCGQYAGLLDETAGTRFSELTVGGGTPLYLSGQQLERMFEMLEAHFQFSGKRECTVETAPNQTDGGKLAVLKQAGVTRVSMGIQSFHDAELTVLGRGHTAGKAKEALALLKTAGFSCINVDFIYGIPGQTVASVLASLKEALAFEPDEIFLYPLYVKHGAGLVRAGVVPDAQGAFLQYEHASAFLRSEGFRQDSMRRFVRQKSPREFCECGFNSSLALGCGGRSYLSNLHFCSPYAAKREECLALLSAYENTQDYTKITHGILLSEEELKRRYAVRHLLIRPGLPVRRYYERFGSSVTDDFPVLLKWMARGFVKQKLVEDKPVKKELPADQKSGPGTVPGHASMKDVYGKQPCSWNTVRTKKLGIHRMLKEEVTARWEEYLALTEEGLGLSDYLGPQLISAPVQRAMEEWEESHGN